MHTVLNIALSNVDAERLKAVSSELNGVAALETPEINDPFAAKPCRECKAKKLPGELH